LIDFWTGEKQLGTNSSESYAYRYYTTLCKGRLIIPWGPKVQYATEKQWDNLEIRVYPGANGEFTLYEDENDNYNYEKGMKFDIT